MDLFNFMGLMEALWLDGGVEKIGGMEGRKKKSTIEASFRANGIRELS
jgi:hypothetical protein